MKKNGFTLIELIVTIVLIGLVGIVISVNMVKVLNDQKTDSEESAIKLVEEAACAYAALSESKCDNGCTVNASTLINASLIDEEINGVDIKSYTITVSYTDGERYCNVN